MQSYAEFNADPKILRRLIPRSVGISPTVFLILLSHWKWSGEKYKKLAKSLFSKYLMLSTGWQELRLYTPCPYNAFYAFQEVHVNGKRNLQLMCMCVIDCIIEFFKNCGIRARQMPYIESKINHPNQRSPTALCKIAENKNKWTAYTNAVPSLSLQCIRVIRSSLEIVTDDRVQKLPVPTLIKELISLKPMVTEMLSNLNLHTGSCS